MAYAKPRPNGRYTAVYQDHQGQEKSAGTFDSADIAFAVAQAQEEYDRKGSAGLDPETRATRTIGEYAPIWLKNHMVEASTKTSYDSCLRANILPVFKDVRVAELGSEQIRHQITRMNEDGASASKQRIFRIVFSAMMRTAVHDGYRRDNPLTGITSKRRASRQNKITVLTTGQFGSMLKELPTKGAQALARIVIGTGCRPSEAFALTPADIDLDLCTVTFDKAVQTSAKKHGPNGQTMFIADTKTHDHRTVKIDKRLLILIRDWIELNGLGPEDLLFPRDLVLSYSRGSRAERRPAIDLTEELIASLGTFLGPNGVRYRHGTMNGYVTGKCGCDHCKQGYADYRWERNQKIRKTTGPTERTMQVSLYPFMNRASWLGMIKAAARDAAIPFTPTAYQLRHTHASWLIANGEDPKTVMVRLGHASLDTTSIYVHAVDDGGSAADIMGDLGAEWDTDD